MYKMTQEEKIDYMIQSLKLAKEEIAYAKEYNAQKAKGNGYISGKRAPNSRIIKETLKMVGRLAPQVAEKCTLSVFNETIFKEDNAG